MNQKNPIKISRLINLHNRQIDGAVLDSIKDLPEKERFDRFLQEDLRIPSSFHPVDLKTAVAIMRLRSSLISAAKTAKTTRKSLRKYVPRVPVKAIAVLSIPFIGYYIAHPDVHNCYRYRLPSSMPVLAMITKTPCPIDWSSLVGTQFFHQIDWNDVGISDYRNDSVFVLFSPKVGFQKKEQYLACFDTEQQFNQPQKREIAKPEKTKTIDLVKVADNSYGPKFNNPLKSVKKHLLGPLRAERALQRHRAKAKVCPDAVTKYIESKPETKQGVFQNLRTLQEIPKNQLKKVRYPKRNLLGFGKVFRKTPALTTHWSLMKSPVKITPAIKSARITNLVSSRDHHVLIPPEGIKQLAINVDPQSTSKDLASKYYWQTYFTSYDLIPAKMESMTFPNKPRLSTEQQYVLDMKTYDKDSKHVDSAYLKPFQKESRDKRKKQYKKQISEEGLLRIEYGLNAKGTKDPDDAFEVASTIKHMREDAIELLDTPTEKNHLIGVNTDTVRRQKHYLVAEDRHKTLDWHQDHPYSIDQLQDASDHRNTLKANWKYRIKQRFLGDHPEWWAAQNIDRPIAPLFNVVSDTSVPKYFKHVDTKVDITKLSRQDPPSKIFLLSEAIQENLHKALESKVAVRQSTRYRMFNSLFNFKSLISRNLYSQDSGKPRPVKLVSDFVLQDSKNARHTLNLNCLKSGLIYETLLQDSHWFNPYENFPYHKVNEIKAARSPIFKPGEISTVSNLQHREKVVCDEPLREKRYGFKKEDLSKKNKPSGKNNSRKTGKTQQDLNETQADLTQFNKLDVNNEKIVKKKKSSVLTEFKLKDLELLDQVIKQKLKRKQDSIDRILGYAKVVYHPFFNKTKAEIQQMVDVRNTSVLKELIEINDEFEAETFGKIKTVQTELEQMQKKREEYYTELIQNFYSFRETLNKTLAELKKESQLPTYFYRFPGDNIEYKQYQKESKEMISRLQNHPIFNFLRFRQPPDEQAYLEREKALLEMCHSKWRSEPFAKSYEVTRDKVIDRFFAQFPYKKIPDEYKQQAFELFEAELIHNFHMSTGKLTTFDVSEQRFIFRDPDKTALSNLAQKETTELDFPFELCTAAEIVEANTNLELDELFTIKPHLDKFRFDSFRLQYQRFLLTNPFRVLPITQQTLFSNISRDFIENNFYQQYVDWYQQFFLQNLNFIKPVFQLDQVLNPEQQNAYLKYSKNIDPGLSQSLKATVNDSNIENILNQQRLKAELDKKQTEAVYKEQAAKNFQAQDHREPYYLDYYENPVQAPVHDPRVYQKTSLHGFFFNRNETKQKKGEAHRQMAKEIRDINKELKQDYLDEEEIGPVANAIGKLHAGKQRPPEDWLEQIRFKVDQQQISDQPNQLEVQPIDQVDPIQNLTLEQLFKDQLVYYLTSQEKPDDLFNQRLVLDQDKNIGSKEEFKTKDFSKTVHEIDTVSVENEQTSVEQKNLEEAYKEISNAFNWTETPVSQEAYQSKLNKEIAEAFISSTNKGSSLKSKQQIQAESKTKQAIRSRVIQGHSPYLQRQLSGYINPDASFRVKHIQLLGWENVFEKARQMYHISKASKTNMISAVRFSFIKRWGKLNTINSPFYQVTSPLPSYHYECFSRLINNRTTALFDFKQLNLHTISKAADPSRSPRRVNYFGITKETMTLPYYQVPAKSVFTGNPVLKDDEPLSVREYYKREAKKEEELLRLAQSPKDKERLVRESEYQRKFTNSAYRNGLTPEDVLAADTLDYNDILYDSSKAEAIKEHYLGEILTHEADEDPQQAIELEEDEDFLSEEESFYYNRFSPLGSEESAENYLKRQNKKLGKLDKITQIQKVIQLEEQIKVMDEDEDEDEDEEVNYEAILDRRSVLSIPQRKPKAKHKRQLFESLYSPKAKAIEKESTKPKESANENQSTKPKESANENQSKKIKSESSKQSAQQRPNQNNKPLRKNKKRRRVLEWKDKMRLGKMRDRLGPLHEVNSLYKYKNNIGLPNSTNALNYNEASLLLDANSLMNKVRNRFFSGTASGYIDHSRFDHSHAQKNKWLTFQDRNSSLSSSREERNDRVVLLNVSVTSPAFWGYIYVLYCLAQMFNRYRLANEGNLYTKLAKFLEKLDLQTAMAFFRTNEAIVRCQGIGFNQMVGGEKLLYLFYPLILLNRNKHFSFGTLPVFEYRLLQKLASPSLGLVKIGDKYELSMLEPTEKEVAMARRLEQARHHMVQIEQKNCLLIGPPGTGKTFFVKALASESHIPVIIPSRHKVQISGLTDMVGIPENADEILRMKQFFKLARKQKPCILFIDEIDAMGKNRNDVQIETKKFYDGPEVIYETSQVLRKKAFGAWQSTVSVSVNTLNLDRLNPEYHMVTNPVRAMHDVIENQRDLKLKYHDNLKKTAKPVPKNDPAPGNDAVSKLTQLLTLVDQTNPRHVLIIGATNRPDSLDPALTRPGRLNNILYLDLPSKQKRLDLLRFYSRSRLSGPIDWDYFAKRTTGLSPAHLQVAMNFSALKNAYEIVEQRRTGQKRVNHSEDSIEYGIQTVKNTNAFTQGFIKRATQKLNSFGAPVFFSDIAQLELWQHMSLGSPIRPIMVSPPNISKTMASETLPTKTETQVWNRMPNHIVRVGFPTLYHNTKKFVYQSLQESQSTTSDRKPLTKNSKIRRELRERFYQRHRKAWRTAYLLSDPKTIDYSLLNNVTVNDHPLVNGLSKTSLLDQVSAQTLQLFKNYVERVFKVHMFGCKLLLHSTYAIDNPLMFKTEFIYRKQKQTVVRSSGQFTRFRSRTPLYLKLLLQPSSTLFIQPNLLETALTQMLSNSLALHRAIAYNANKALMVHLLTDTYQQDHMYDIWNRVKYDMNPEQYQRIFIKAIKENFVTRKQFENYLLALSAGKVGEHLMLFYREALPKYDPFKPRFGRYTYDVSEIGREELHQMSWLLNIMIEKNLFYSPTVDLSKQALVSENKSRLVSKHNSSLIAVAANKELWTEFDRKTYGLTNRYDKGLFVHNFMKLFRAKPKRTYWWSPDHAVLTSQLPAHPSKMWTMNHWVRLFDRKPFKVQRLPTNLQYDTYRANVLRTPSLLDAPFDAKYLPSNFVEAVTKQGGTWNQTCFSTTERITRAILLDTFAKSFYILTSQRELSDYLSYYLIRCGKVQANQMKELSQIFLEPALAERLQQIEKDKAIDEMMQKLQKNRKND